MFALSCKCNIDYNKLKCIELIYRNKYLQIQFNSFEAPFKQTPHTLQKKLLYHYILINCDFINIVVIIVVVVIIFVI